MSKKVKVMVVKMSVVDGKKMGESVSLYLDPEVMARYTTVAMVKKRVLQTIADTRIFAPEDLAGLKMEMREFLKEWRAEVKKKEEERRKKLEKIDNK